MAPEKPYTMGDYVGVLRRRWVFPAVFLSAGVLIAVYIAFTVTPIYQASATIMLELSSIPEELVKTSIAAYTDQEIELVRRKIMTTENLAALIEEVDPYPQLVDLDVRAKAQLVSDDTTVERVDPITLEPLAQSNAFSIYYDNEDPSIAREITARLANMFLSYNRAERTEAASDTYRFLEAQSEQASKGILELEHKLADFKAKYGEALPEAQAYNQASLDRVERELESLRQQILTSNERRSLLEVQLSQINPVLFDPNGDWRTELANMRQELAVAQQRYTPDHPDVKRLRRAIEALSQRADVAGATTRPDNPEYLAVQSQLDAVKRELAGYEAQASRARDQISTYERSLKMTPQVEREYSQLKRDYDVAQERFRGIEASLAEAALGRELESEQRGDKLTLIRGAYRPTKPAYPNRLGIILIGVILGGGLGVGLAALAESSDPTIRSPRDLAEITDIKPLAAVPFMMNPADRRRRLLAWTGALVVAVVAVSIVMSAVIDASS